MDVKYFLFVWEILNCELMYEKKQSQFQSALSSFSPEKKNVKGNERMYITVKVIVCLLMWLLAISQ